MTAPLNDQPTETTEDPGWTDELGQDPFDDPSRPDYAPDDTVGTN